MKNYTETSNKALLITKHAANNTGLPVGENF